MSFLHGVELIEDNSGPRPIRTVSSSVIGVVATAKDAKIKEEAFPINTPVVCTPANIADFDFGTGTMEDAVTGIFAQSGAILVLVRAEDADTDAEQANKIAGNLLEKTGVHALVAAGTAPKILVAPGFSDVPAVQDQLKTAAQKLRAVAIVDAPQSLDLSSLDNVANDYATAVSDRVYMVYPSVKVQGANGIEERPLSPRVAGIIARTDNEAGFWHSPSNKQINGVLGMTTPIDFALGDSTSLANQLNAANLGTVIQQDGFRLWGNRGMGADPKFAFLSVRRTADMINESLLRAHMWAIDRNITKTYIEDVTEGVNSYLRQLQAEGAILGGECWADPTLNSPSAIANGQVYFNFDFTPPYPAEHIRFTSSLVNDYLEEII